MSDSDVPLGSDRLRDRLVLAAVNALAEGDPVLMIGVGDNEVRIGWVNDLPRPSPDSQIRPQTDD
jgi:hypothetical protein